MLRSHFVGEKLHSSGDFSARRRRRQSNSSDSPTAAPRSPPPLPRKPILPALQGLERAASLEPMTLVVFVAA